MLTKINSLFTWKDPSIRQSHWTKEASETCLGAQQVLNKYLWMDGARAGMAACFELLSSTAGWRVQSEFSSQIHTKSVLFPVPTFRIGLEGPWEGWERSV